MKRKLYIWYCDLCGLWIASDPLRPQEIRQLHESYCEQCGEPLAETLRRDSVDELFGRTARRDF
jgi:hypothetical protein